MKKEEVTIGMQVVPHRKSVACSLNQSAQYKETLKLKQPYMIVVHQHYEDRQNNTGKYLLGYSKEQIGLGGDYFMADDFEPYTGGD